MMMGDVADFVILLLGHYHVFEGRYSAAGDVGWVTGTSG